MSKDNKDGKINIKKWREDIRNTEKAVLRNKSRLVCKCKHQYPSGELAIAMTKGRDAKGRPICRCMLCGKEVNINKIDPQDLDAAIEVVDHACDIIKFSSNPKSEKDQKIVERISKLQSRVINELKVYYEAARDHTNKNRNRGHQRDGDDVIINRPSSR